MSSNDSFQELILLFLILSFCCFLTIICFDHFCLFYSLIISIFYDFLVQTLNLIIYVMLYANGCRVYAKIWYVGNVTGMNCGIVFNPRFFLKQNIIWYFYFMNILSVNTCIFAMLYSNLFDSFYNMTIIICLIYIRQCEKLL